jgi:hypothetical protein
MQILFSTWFWGSARDTLSPSTRAGSPFCPFSASRYPPLFVFLATYLPLSLERTNERYEDTTTRGGRVKGREFCVNPVAVLSFFFASLLVT